MRALLLVLAVVLAGCVRELPSDTRADAELADTVYLNEVTLRTVSIKGPGGLRHQCIVATRPNLQTPPAIDCNW